ncbi:efflux RND transporter periplasmic adaptor subunit [Leptolyngbya sp. 7M]|uniref:efflux RND transporter periplasmic adaptor subunit n=1 Tax=Leptolyngbya sp. 7M TaxID=2812896 RepID=UPI001B8AAF13|nr:efflux RND transporter periplasmic adaptor subunit [Leptolyngbya sp. 7M]QYO65515.1 efflux RND transporter periplasmic adaptor subunit [Leptolyngbya sp. 7M]
MLRESRRLKLPLLLAAAIGISGCSYFVSSGGGRQSANTATNTAEAEVVPITVGKTESREVPAVVQATGSMVADESSNIAPKIAGKVADIAVNSGDFVTSGQVIARIDDRDARLRLASAEASVKQAQAAVRQAEARLGLSPNGRFDASSIPEVRAANANYQLALAELRQAEANEKRYRELVETGDVAMIAYEQYRTTRDTARARANNAKEQLDAAVNTARQNNEAIRSAEANVEAARTQVATARQELADTVVRAPFAGFISERQVAVGEFVSTATVIATLLRTNPIKIQIQVAETDVPSIVLGRGVSIEVDAYRGRRFAGTVSAINPAVDAVSRSAIVEASIPNNENLLRTGMFATARINKEGGSTGVFAPKSAIYTHQATQSYRAFVITEGVARLRTIQLGPEEGDYYQILSGLNADEIVATSNLAELYEGAKVAY